MFQNTRGNTRHALIKGQFSREPVIGLVLLWGEGIPVCLGESMIIGYMLRLWMASEGFTMGDVAKEIGISKSTLSRICAGHLPDAQTLIKLVRYLFEE